MERKCSRISLFIKKVWILSLPHLSSDGIFFRKQENKQHIENFQRFCHLIKVKASFMECIFYFEGHCHLFLPRKFSSLIKIKFLLHLSRTLTYKSQRSSSTFFTITIYDLWTLIHIRKWVLEAPSVCMEFII